MAVSHTDKRLAATLNSYPKDTARLIEGYGNCGIGPCPPEKVDTVSPVSAFLKNGQVALFPNPAGDRVFIKAVSEVPFFVEIFDATGSRKALFEKPPTDGPIEISLMGFSSGQYFLKLSGLKSGPLWKRFVKS